VQTWHFLEKYARSFTETVEGSSQQAACLATFVRRRIHLKAASGRIRVFQADALSPFDFEAAQNGRRHSIGQGAQDERTLRDQRAVLFFQKEKKIFAPLVTKSR
jgi:hypothetical protein